ncbi:hypothetical protein ACN4EK_31775 [Pantanalinema rosaneae CENA516]|uniref:hypothetical protein n=1 Tax=Pantanalinema rosaneae TaxID=1620701 RepID=UPI003D701A6C
MRIANFAEIRASLICSSGGQFGPLAAYQPPPLLDCPPLRDPLASRAAPAVGACTETGLVVRSRRTLTPGVYCGGIRIEQGAEVTLDPGLYVIKDGPLAVEDGALIGRHTSFFFTGAAAVLAFDRSSTIDLSAMRDGALAASCSSRTARRRRGGIFASRATTPATCSARSTCREAIYSSIRGAAWRTIRRSPSSWPAS